MHGLTLLAFKPISGIYYIHNLEDSRIYIGQSNDIYSRWTQHVKDLIYNRHTNKELLKDFQKRGLGGFMVGILEECDEADLSEREQYYMDKYLKDEIKLYNIRLKNN